MVYSISFSNVQTLIGDGKIIIRDRQILTVDKTEVIGTVKAIVERLKQPYL
ncbi:hypothetical protein QUB80_32660 [Chlorogloeopsis sp. ULAP01]|uniref:hypothetical protein n=1 Tax=Chlorogloeopsis sp. ULAP01 TaxID=3056483 RepID=UPI0025AAB691|nr:hypothetical protein [Chlorogloeopsis sp. ULAP01]MDM9385407.1 hypothetical protein [Chlorogloeopsis sp. ULAP01]